MSLMVAKSLGSKMTPSVPTSRVSRAVLASSTFDAAATIFTFSFWRSAMMFSRGMMVQSVPTRII